MLEDGFTGVVVGEAVDTKGEDKARAYEVYGYAFLATRLPGRPRQ